PAQLGVSGAVLEVREAVADRFGDHRGARLSARVLPRALRHEAQVHPPPAVDRAVPDQLPAAGARLEGDPRQPGRGQYVPLLDRASLPGSPALAAPLPVRNRLPRLGNGLGAGDLSARRRRCPHGRLRTLPPAASGGCGLMDVALSKNGARLLRLFFVLVVVFLYAPIVILLIFSFNKSAVPTFPLSGFTLHWYRAFLANSEIRGALETSAIIA